MKDLNYVTLLIAAAFAIPVVIGIFKPFTRRQVQYSMGALLDNIEFLAGIFLSIFLTKKIFFEHETGTFFSKVYSWIPSNIKEPLFGKDILTYIIATPVLLLLVLLVLRLLTNPVYSRLLVPSANRIFDAMNSMGRPVKRLAGALWQLPRAFYLPFIAVLLLNFYTYYFYSPVLGKWMNDSAPYQLIYKKALYPVLNSNIAKEIPVILNDSFSRQLGQKLSGVWVTEYFNGVTLEEAVKSTPEIDETARKLVGNEKDSGKKALILYKWVSKNVKYDYDKARKISSNPKAYSSGAVEAFNTHTGICFDYSSLYVAMARAVGLKVRLVTGLGYSGVSWGDHAWNQVYYREEERWINLDATFGSSGVNYFDKQDFAVDHREDVVRGEW